MGTIHGHLIQVVRVSGHQKAKKASKEGRKEGRKETATETHAEEHEAQGVVSPLHYSSPNILVGIRVFTKLEEWQSFWDFFLHFTRPTRFQPRSQLDAWMHGQRPGVFRLFCPYLSRSIRCSILKGYIIPSQRARRISSTLIGNRTMTQVQKLNPSGY